jgi:hypothetical protein
VASIGPRAVAEVARLGPDMATGLEAAMGRARTSSSEGKWPGGLVKAESIGSGSGGTGSGGGCRARASGDLGQMTGVAGGINRAQGNCMGTAVAEAAAGVMGADNGVGRAEGNGWNGLARP